MRTYSLLRPSSRRQSVYGAAWTKAILITTMTGVGMAGCGSDSTFVSPDSTRVMVAATIPVHAATLATVAPYDTVRLPVAVRMGDNTNLDLTAPGVVVTYSSSDTTVTVDTSGLVTARYPTGFGSGAARVTVSVHYAGHTRSDAAFVMVTTDAPAPGTFALHLGPAPDSTTKVTARCGPAVPTCANTQQLRVSITTADGDSLTGVPVAFRSTDTSAARIDTMGVVMGLLPGRAILHASTYVYGQQLHDSLPFTVTEVDRVVSMLVGPRLEVSSPVYRLSPDTIRVVAGGIVVWTNGGTDSLDIIFDSPPGPVDSADASRASLYWVLGAYEGVLGHVGPLPATGQGNVAPFAGDFKRRDREIAMRNGINDPDYILFYQAYEDYDLRGLRARRFSVAGEYPYHSNHINVHGLVRVCAEICAP